MSCSTCETANIKSVHDSANLTLFLPLSPYFATASGLTKKLGGTRMNSPGWPHILEFFVKTSSIGISFSSIVSSTRTSAFR